MTAAPPGSASERVTGREEVGAQIIIIRASVLCVCVCVRVSVRACVMLVPLFASSVPIICLCAHMNVLARTRPCAGQSAWPLTAAMGQINCRSIIVRVDMEQDENKVSVLAFRPLVPNFPSFQRARGMREAPECVLAADAQTELLLIVCLCSKQDEDEDDDGQQRLTSFLNAR